MAKITEVIHYTRSSSSAFHIDEARNHFQIGINGNYSHLVILKLDTEGVGLKSITFNPYGGSWASQYNLLLYARYKIFTDYASADAYVKTFDYQPSSAAYDGQWENFQTQTSVTANGEGKLYGTAYMALWSQSGADRYYIAWDYPSVFKITGVTATSPARTISYNANGHGTAPASQTGYDKYALTLRSVISPVSETNTEAGASEDVVFNANGGNATPTAQPTIPSITYSDKFTQLNWKLDNGSTTYNGGASYTVSGAHTFYANWNRTQHDETSRVYSTVTLPAAIDRSDEKFAEYTVTLDARNGSATTQKLSDRMRKWAFGGWNTNESGTGTNYPAGGSYTNGGATLYAKWDNNGEYALPITLPEPKRSGYKFMGWAESTSAKEGVMDEYTPSADVVLYAIWKVIDSARVYKDGKWRMVLPYVFKDGKWHLTQSTIKR